jgi:phosphotransferase system enzyme I (PtsP)
MNLKISDLPSKDEMPRDITDQEDPLLLTLEETSKLVAHTRDPAETLENIVELISNRFKADVCSVYFLESSGTELVLGATVGLRKDSIGKVKLKTTEGLVGLVAETLRPVMVANAFSHPRFKYIPEAGEDPFLSFLGVPLVKAGGLVGVIVIQTEEPRNFSINEIRTLVTVAAQLTTVASDARLLSQLTAATHEPFQPSENFLINHELHSRLLSPGIGVGRTYSIDSLEEWRASTTFKSAGIEIEKERMEKAISLAKEELSAMSVRIAHLVGQDHGAILDAQLMILQDRTIEKDLVTCLTEGKSSETALISTLDKYLAAFQKIKTPFFQERIYDIKDVFLRILWNLRPQKSNGGTSQDRIILVCKEASVMELFAVSPEKLAGVIVEKGGPECHAAILARALGIPMMQISDRFQDLLIPGKVVLIDGPNQSICLNPNETRIQKLNESFVLSDPVYSTLPKSEKTPSVFVNINLLWEVPTALHLGAEGVGLFRSEFMLLARRTIPTEEEQFAIYSKLLKNMNGKHTTIRTFDLRPDKLASFSDIGGTASRAYDWRKVLDSPPLQKLFYEQVRAIMRAGVEGKPKILIPLVASTETLEFVMQTLQDARESLSQEKLDHNPEIPLGLMVETAASIPMMPFWADKADFFALGTNDLFASVLGLDRNEESGSSQCDHCHPGFLKILSSAIDHAHNSGKPITVCGELASDPLGATFLASQNVTAISVSVQRLHSISRVLSSVNQSQLNDFRAKFLKLNKASEVRELLLSAIKPNIK